MSLGTNDLIQYTLAADRTSRDLAYLASPFDPSVLRLIAIVVAAARRQQTPLSICGEMASDPLGAILLVGLGLRELSMEASAVPEIKETLRRVRLAEAEALAEQVVNFETADAVWGEGAKRFRADSAGYAGVGSALLSVRIFRSAAVVAPCVMPGGNSLEPDVQRDLA